MTYEKYIEELIDFFKEMKIESEFKNEILYIKYVPNDMMDQYQQVLHTARGSSRLIYGKTIHVYETFKVL